MSDARTAGRSTGRLPERVERDGLVIARWRPEDAPALHESIVANVDHLRPFMAWAAGEPRTLTEHRALIDTWTAGWAAGGDLVAGIRRDGEVIGSTGLHRRGGPDVLEIGYWVDHRYLRQGVATTVSRALTGLAFTVPGVETVVLAHDLANVASAGVPAALGYRRVDDREPIAPTGPAGVGRDGVWLMARADWTASGSAGR